MDFSMVYEFRILSGGLLHLKLYQEGGEIHQRDTYG